MATYLVRVELHGAAAAVYARLHVSMEARGFQRWVRLSDGRYELPTAEYVIERASGQCSNVRQGAYDAARATGYKSSILVVEVYRNEICSIDLRKIE